MQAQACNFIKKTTLAQAFSCEFCEISKNTFFTEHLWTAASAHGYFCDNETNSFTVLGGSPELLKFASNVCDLLSIEELSRDR